MTTLGDGGDNARIVVEANQLLQTSNVHLNVDQVLIVVTEDKLRLCLARRVESIASRQGWIAPAGLFVSLFVALLTSTFHDFGGLKKEVWEAIFMLGTLGSAGWLFAAIVRAARAPSLESLVLEIKKGALAKEGGV